MSAMNAGATGLLDRIAGLLEYPGREFEAKLEMASTLAGGDTLPEKMSERSARELRQACARLGEALERIGRLRAEERYTLLFDLTPTCTLDVGYHLFGENYARGELLAGLNGELRAHGVDSGGELPDHLPVLLRLLGRQEDPREQRILTSVVLLPGLLKINTELQDNEDPWSELLRALPAVLEELVPADAEELREVVHA